MEKAEAACPSESLSFFRFPLDTRSCEWQQGPDKDNTEQHTADQTHTQDGYSAALRLIGLDGEERGRPVGLPHGRLHVMWSQRRRCDSAGEGEGHKISTMRMKVGSSGRFDLDESLKSHFKLLLVIGSFYEVLYHLEISPMWSHVTCRVQPQTTCEGGSK